MYETETQTETQTKPMTRLRRSSTDRMISGVCGGIANSLGVDAAIVRIALVAATLLGFGAGAVLYVICWMVMPQE